MKNFLRKISWVVLGAVLAITTIIYICPMTTNDNSQIIMNLSHDPCQSAESGSNSSANSTQNCLDTHLSLTSQLLGDNTNMVNLLLTFSLFTAIYSIFFRNLLLIIKPLLDRLRRYYFYYYLSIKLLITKKFLTYLNFLKNFSIVSLV